MSPRGLAVGVLMLALAAGSGAAADRSKPPAAIVEATASQPAQQSSRCAPSRKARCLPGSRTGRPVVRLAA